MVPRFLRMLPNKADAREFRLSIPPRIEMTKARFVKFSLRSVLVLTGLIAIALWWIRWPSQIASQLVADRDAFLAALEDSEPATYDRYLRDSTPLDDATHSGLHVFPRAWNDAINGRQAFGFGPFLFSIERGSVVSGPSWHFRSGNLWITR